MFRLLFLHMHWTSIFRNDAIPMVAPREIHPYENLQLYRGPEWDCWETNT